MTYSTVGGRNGYGAKLCNIFSNKFVVETQTNDNQKAFKQVTCKHLLSFPVVHWHSVVADLLVAD